MVPRLELALIKFWAQTDQPNYAVLSSIYPQKSNRNVVFIGLCYILQRGRSYMTPIYCAAGENFEDFIVKMMISQ